MTDNQTKTDYLIRAVAMEGQLRVTIANTTHLVAEVARRHTMTPVACAATGRVATAALMLGTTLKDEQIVTIQIRGTGPLEMIRATADAHGTVRAYTRRPHEGAGHDVKSAVGAGEGSLVEVIKDLGLKDPYHGLVPLTTGTIYDDLAYYLLMSEQTRSAVALSESISDTGEVLAAGGYLVQALPGAGDDVEERIRTLPSISAMIASGMSPEEILAELLVDEKTSVVVRQDIQFLCPCSRERFAVGLQLVGREDALDIVDKEGAPVELVCHFCAEAYHFTRAQILEIFEVN